MISRRQTGQAIVEWRGLKSVEQQLDFDLREGRRLRDEGIQKVTDNNERWHDRAMIALQSFAGSGKIMKGEDMRAAIISQVGKPNHHNAWGALIRHAYLVGLIKPTGMMASAESKKTHSHKVALWKF